VTDQPTPSGSAAAPPTGPIITLPPPPEFLVAAGELGIEFEPDDVPRLGRYLQMLLEANRTTNLTGITDPAEAWRKHILDALALVPLIASFAADRQNRDREAADPTSGDIETPSDAGEPSDLTTPGPLPHGRGSDGRGSTPLSLIDIGSGGGVPAIPLAIVLPDLRVTLVEATGKKVDFLRRVIADLKLKNTRVIQGRAETLGQDHRLHREHYDLATARALGHLNIVIELLGPLIRPHGLLLAIKGGKADQELGESKKALGLIGLKHLQTVDTPTGRVVTLDKTTRTPRLYPRRDGEPARAPLKG